MTPSAIYLTGNVVHSKTSTFHVLYRNERNNITHVGSERANNIGLRTRKSVLYVTHAIVLDNNMTKSVYSLSSLHITSTKYREAIQKMRLLTNNAIRGGAKEAVI